MSAKRNLLLGILALQNNFINRTQLLAAFNAWTADNKGFIRESRVLFLK